MMDEVVALEDVTFSKILSYVLNGFKMIHSVILILSVGIAASEEILDFFYLFTISFIYSFSILFSIAIHEYAHIWWIKKLTTHNKVRIVITKAAFSIRPLE